MKRSALQLELAFLARHKALYAAVLFWRGVWELVPMQVPLLAGIAVDGLTGKGLRLCGFQWPDASPLEVVQLAALGLAAVALIFGLSAFAYTVAGTRLDKGFVAGLRKAVVEKVLFLPLDEHLRFGSGALLDRVLRDTDRLRGFTEQVFTRIPTNIVRAAYPVLMLFLIHPVLAVVALAVVPPQWLMTSYLQKRLHASTRKSLASHTDLAAATQESLDGVETVKALDAEVRTVAAIHRHAERVEIDELAASRTTALVRCTIWSMTSVGIALLWWLGGMRVLTGELTVGALVALTGFAELAYRPFRRFSEIVKTYRAGLASLERIQELLEAEPAGPAPTASSGRPLVVSAGAITLRHVSFSYGSQQVLADVSLDIEPGRLTAVVGPSGAGKSTLLRLIARLYEPESGQLLIDGQPLAGSSRADLRASLAVVPQRPAVFSGTIRDNVCLGKPGATTEEIRAACEAAAALAFIERLDRGFDTRLGRHGVSLAAGEVQRLAIARALLRWPKILLMDEPTAALDAVSETAVVRALLALRGPMTLVVVGHRPEAVRLADRVIVLDAGRVVAEGTHEDLLTRSEQHRQLFGTGEPANVGAA
jgi:ABC-type multidrug transport system fused ATPase/permease subunit